MEYIALGCMSGTSLDGIDCSLVKSDGVSYVTDISNEFIPYSDDLQLKLRNVILKGYLDDTKVINQLNQEYKDSINNFIKKNNFEIDLIAMHGQTIYHDQKTKISIQLFDKSIRFNTNSPVICNFRKNDLLNGGNGAPIMPEFHRVLANQLGLAGAQQQQSRALQDLSRGQFGQAGFQTGLSNFLQSSRAADIQALGGLGSLRQGITQAQLTADQQAAQTAAFEPQQRLQQFGAGLGQIAGLGTVTPELPTQAPSALDKALGTALGVGGLYAKIFAKPQVVIR